MLESILISGVFVITQGIVLVVIKKWFSGVDTRLDKLNGFKDEVLKNYATKKDLKQQEGRCDIKHGDMFNRLHDLEIKDH